jgi:5-carboxymethyl-2-hydroxymuconate isomerase
LPHIVLEHSADLKSSLNESQILVKMHEMFIDTGVFSPRAVRARSISYDDYVLTGAGESFVHVSVSILAGRSDEQIEMLCDNLFSLLKDNITQTDNVSLEIREMNPKTYRK